MEAPQLKSNLLLHDWLRNIKISFVPGATSKLLDTFVKRLFAKFQKQGHGVQISPDNHTDIVLTTALFGQPIPTEDALLFNVTKRFNLTHSPTIYTVVHVKPDDFTSVLKHFEGALSKNESDPNDFAFAGLPDQAHRVLIGQGQRGGPILSLERMLQGQMKSIRVLLLIGENRPLGVYHFDLVGAHPYTSSDHPDGLYTDIVHRMASAVSTGSITEQELAEPALSLEIWKGLKTPAAMVRASKELDQRHFFTEIVYVSDLIDSPGLSKVIASQFSEGCFGTWDLHLDALISTVTGSARPVEKGNLNDADLTVVTGLRSDERGTLYRQVSGKDNYPPSAEAFEMFAMDRDLPRIPIQNNDKQTVRVPAIRSKLHGHRGVASYDPRFVEYAPMAPAYFNYMVSCGNQAQAEGIIEGVANAETFKNPDDPRKLVFTILPGHGIFILEKWVPGKVPFQVIWEYMDAGHIVIEKSVPQGPTKYVTDKSGQRVKQTQTFQFKES